MRVAAEVPLEVVLDGLSGIRRPPVRGAGFIYAIRENEFAPLVSHVNQDVEDGGDTAHGRWCEYHVVDHLGTEPSPLQGAADTGKQKDYRQERDRREQDEPINHGLPQAVQPLVRKTRSPTAVSKETGRGNPSLPMISVYVQRATAKAVPGKSAAKTVHRTS